MTVVVDRSRAATRSSALCSVSTSSFVLGIGKDPLVPQHPELGQVAGCLTALDLPGLLHKGLDVGRWRSRGGRSQKGRPEIPTWPTTSPRSTTNGRTCSVSMFVSGMAEYRR